MTCHPTGGTVLTLCCSSCFDPDLHEPLLQTLANVLKPGMGRTRSSVTARSVWASWRCSTTRATDAAVIDLKETLNLGEDEILYAHVITRRPLVGGQAEGAANKGATAEGATNDSSPAKGSSSEASRRPRAWRRGEGLAPMYPVATPYRRTKKY